MEITKSDKDEILVLFSAVGTGTWVKNHERDAFAWKVAAIVVSGITVKTPAQCKPHTISTTCVGA